MDFSSMIHDHNVESRLKQEYNDSESIESELNTTIHPNFNKIKLRLKLDLISVPIFAFPLCVGIVCMILFLMEGRWSGYLPTISETGTEHPNREFFASMMSCGSVTSLFILFMYFNYMKLTLSISCLANTFLVITLILGVIGVGGLGFCPINEVYRFHFAFAFTGFSGILLFETISYFVGKKSTKLAVLRAFLIFMAYCGYFLFGFSEIPFKENTEVTVSTIGEWTLLFCMQFVFVTWGQEMKFMNVHIAFLP